MLRPRLLLTCSLCLVLVAPHLSQSLWADDPNGLDVSADSGASKTTDQSNGQDSQDSTEKSAEYWAEQLGHDRFLRREAATRKLIAAGDTSVQPLLKVIESGNLEINQRAVLVLSALAGKQHHAADDGALLALRTLSQQSIGSRKSMVDRAISDLESDRLKQALVALKSEGYQIGHFSYTFNLATFLAPVQMLKIDDDWKNDRDLVSWSRWLSDIRVVVLSGDAVCKEVIQEVARMKELRWLTLLDGSVDAEALDALKDVQKLEHVELRYVSVDEPTLQALAQVPIRVELSLMGTGVTAEQAALIEQRLPGLLVHQHSGAFLGVKCEPSGSSCVITEVIEGSAAHAAGLERDDIIVGLGDVRVQSFEDLRNKIKQHVAGDDLLVKYIRGQDEFETSAVLRKYKSP